MSRWRNVILPFHNMIKVTNAILIPYITFFSPILRMSQRSWKTFLQPIRDLLWRNKPGEGKPWHWGQWDMVAAPKERGGLGIINPVYHAKALCAKLFVSLASSNQTWAIICREMITQSQIFSAGGEWKGMSVENKLLCPKGTTLKLGGNTGALVTKCIVAAKCLSWKEIPRYFSNSCT